MHMSSTFSIICKIEISIKSHRTILDNLVLTQKSMQNSVSDAATNSFVGHSYNATILLYNSYPATASDSTSGLLLEHWRMS